MKKNLFLIFGFVCLNLIGFGCTEDSFYSSEGKYQNPYDLRYADVLNAREYSSIHTGKPTVMTGGLIPVFEIVSIKDGDGNLLTGEYLSTVSILNADTIENSLDADDWYVLDGDTVKSYTGVDSYEAGMIVIEDENPYGIGDYYFTIKVTVTTPEGEKLSTTFEDAFHLQIGPKLVNNLLYWPIVQNIVVEGSSSTTKPFILEGNSEVIFSLESDTEKLTIDSETGVVSLIAGYSVTENDTLIPTIKVTSKISGEEVSFQGEDFLKLIVSKDPLEDIPSVDMINIFYPTMEARNSIYGYTYKIVSAGSVSEANVWTPQSFKNSFPGAVDERPADIASSIKSIMTNVTSGDNLPHESWVIMNSQNISLYKNDFDMEAIFYIQNKYVEYLDDGRTPTNLSVKVTTEYTGDVQKTVWEDVSDIVVCAIQNDPENTFVGLPYPGDQTGDDPDGKKGPNADGRWVKCVLDLSPYKESKNFTLAFHLESLYDGVIVYNGTPGGRPGRYYISDVHYVAKIK
ncbi:hypothetical protein ACT29H_11610 [Thermophagus sp. OGC60D27]|uniref:hypothetical protein n=1 Tax=Thermophagus sp. OGC60D27 TaxID=3458415 RepID=UPI0040384EAC